MKLKFRGRAGKRSFTKEEIRIKLSRMALGKANRFLARANLRRPIAPFRASHYESVIFPDNKLVL